MTDDKLVALYPDKVNAVTNSLEEDQKDAQILLQHVMDQNPEAVQITYMAGGSVRSQVSDQPFHTLAILYGYSQVHFHNTLCKSIEHLPSPEEE